MITHSTHNGSVTIHTGPFLAMVEGRSVDVVQPLLSIKAYWFDKQARRKTKTWRPFEKTHDRLYFALGLAPHVQRELRQMGHEVSEGKLDVGMCDEGRELLQRSFAQSEEGLIMSAAAGGKHRAQLPARSAIEKADAIAGMAAMYPNNSMLVVAKNLKLRVQLDSLLATKDLVCPPTIVTSYTFANRAVEWVDIVVFADVESALLKSSVHHLNTWGDTFHCFTLANPSASRLPRERLWIDALLGPWIGQPPETPAWPTVVLASSPPLASMRPCSALEKKRRAIWHDTERNQRIASLARGIHQGHCRKLVQEGLLTEGQAEAVFATRRPAVSLLVESLEHGKRLHELLPRWELLYRAEPFAWPNPRLIYTQMAAHDTWTVLHGVIIRCDGQHQWPLTPLPLASGQHAVVIDLAPPETRHKQAEAYERLGWQIVD